jgi:hypothetical protein
MYTANSTKFCLFILKFFSSHKRNQQITFNVMFFYCDETGKVSVVFDCDVGVHLILWRLYWVTF